MTEVMGMRGNDGSLWHETDIRRFIVFSRLCFIIEARRSGHLPWFIGSTLRGSLARACRRLICVSMDRDHCKGCPQEFECPYAYLFETSVPPGSERLRSLSTIPHPLVIDALEPGGEFKAGRRIRFDITLFGKGRTHRKFLEAGVDAMGFQGLGREHIPFRLVDVLWGSSFPHLPQPEDKTDLDIPKPGMDQVTIWFQTPTRLVRNGTIMEHPDFRTVVRSVVSRASSISYFHCNHALNIDFKEMLREAEDVRIEEERTRFFKLWRYSARQNKRIPLTGIVGWTKFGGRDLARFHGILDVGQRLHIGKSTVHGLGKYHLFKP